MGFFSRLKNVVQGKANEALDKAEDPIQLMKLSITKKKEALQKAKLASATFIGSVSGKSEDIQELEAKATKYEEGIKKALSQQDEVKAKELLVIKKKYDTQLVTMKSEFAQLEASANKAKENIIALEEEIQSLEVKCKQLEARYKTAKSQQQVNEILADISDDNMPSFDAIEAKVREAEAHAKGLESFIKSDEDQLLETYLNTVDTSLDDELEKYKASL